MNLGYRIRMRSYPDPADTLWETILALMGYTPGCGERRPGIDAVLKRIKRHGDIGRGTLQRIMQKTAATQLASLKTIADALGVPVWRLLQPPGGALPPDAIEAAYLYDGIPPEDRAHAMHYLRRLSVTHQAAAPDDGDAEPEGETVGPMPAPARPRQRRPQDAGAPGD